MINFPDVCEATVDQYHRERAAAKTLSSVLNKSAKEVRGMFASILGFTFVARGQ